MTDRERYAQHVVATLVKRRASPTDRAEAAILIETLMRENEELRKMNEKDMEYLGNINTSPGPNAGRSIDPTKPGPDVEPRQGVRALEKAADALSYAAACLQDAEWPTAANHCLRAEAKARAALAQSDAEPLREVYDKVKGHAVTQSEK